LEVILEVKSNKQVLGRQHDHQPRSRPTIGILLERLHAYNFKVLCGIADTVQEHGANVIAFAGGSLRHPNPFLARSKLIYDLVNPEMIDGLIILTSTLGHYISTIEVREFCQRYAPLPMVSLGNILEDIPSVVVDNNLGLHALMAHLIVDHGYRRIAFVKGPANNPDAKQRYLAYTEFMKQYGLPLDPQLIIPGDFSFESGLNAVDLLLDQRKVEVEAIVTTCDGVALAVMEALRRRSIHVPGAIAVAGFDDSARSKYATPPLTTVRQPVYEHGRRAAEVILARLQGETLSEVVTLPTELIVRQSCGCLSQAVQQARLEDVATITIAQPREKRVDLLQQAHILTEMNLALKDSVSTYHTTFNSEAIAQLLEAFLIELKDQTSQLFLPTLDKVLRPMMAMGDDISLWQEVLSTLRRKVWPYLASRAELARAENLWYQAQVLLGEMIRQAQAQQDLLRERQNQTLQEISQTLITTFELKQLLDTVAQCLPQLGIQSCYLCLYDPNSSSANEGQLPEKARLILAYTEKGRLELGSKELCFPSGCLLPAGTLPERRQYTLVVLPLYFRENQLGFILFEMGPQTDTVYEALQSQISSALQGALLVQQVQNHALDLELEVLRRTAELKSLNQQLEVYASELGAKNAELERFTYTVSHDLKSPLITIQGFLGMLEKDALAGDLELMQGDVRHIRDAVKQMNNLLDDLLELSRIGRVSHSMEAISLYELACEAVDLVAGQIVERGVKVDISPQLPVVFGDRPRLLEVLQNLIDNAVKYMDGQLEPYIEIGVRPLQGASIYYVRDNGMGIEPRYHEKVFGLFERLQAGTPGTGIGLALVKRIIELHGGNIWVESEGKGQGSIFCFTLSQPGEQINHE
jgi:signal transduction histidine kinase/DNA-binding LacI/PurR family transcriptional regulator